METRSDTLFKTARREVIASSESHSKIMAWPKMDLGHAIFRLRLLKAVNRKSWVTTRMLRSSWYGSIQSPILAPSTSFKKCNVIHLAGAFSSTREKKNRRRYPVVCNKKSNKSAPRIRILSFKLRCSDRIQTGNRLVEVILSGVNLLSKSILNLLNR